MTSPKPKRPTLREIRQQGIQELADRLDAALAKNRRLEGSVKALLQEAEKRQIEGAVAQEPKPLLDWLAFAASAAKTQGADGLLLEANGYRMEACYWLIDGERLVIGGRNPQLDVKRKP